MPTSHTNDILISRSDQHLILLALFEGLFNCIKPVVDSNATGLEQDWSKDMHSPLLWKYGSVVFFWDHYFVQVVFPGDNPVLDKRTSALYDSFYVKDLPFGSRFTLKLPNVNDTLHHADMIWMYIEKWILRVRTHEDSAVQAFKACLRYSHNVLEELLCDYQLLEKSNPLTVYPFNISAKVVPLNVEFIKIRGGTFRQGSPNDNSTLVWSDELGSFDTTVDDFMVSKHLITQGQFVTFVEDGGYKMLKHWSPSGRQWLKQIKPSNPVYWKLQNGVWYRRLFDKWVILEPNKPMVHVNFFEAQAYCNWAGGRLMTESEWEYLATEGGETIRTPAYGGNLGLERFDINSVDEEATTSWGVSNMIGNVWCWCDTIFYPYPDYNCDGVCPEDTLVKFGCEYVARGGSWASSRLLLSKSFRQSFSPDARKNLTGFRIAR